MQHVLAAIVVLAGVSLCGCGPGLAHAGTTASVPFADGGAVERWRATGDYDALLELVDAHIDPAWNGKVSKADVTRYLGEGIHDPDGYPNAGPDFWVYSSRRPVPVGSYLYIAFTGDGLVKAVSWGSE
jgi:hypothetical protein